MLDGMTAHRSYADVFAGFPLVDVASWLGHRSLLVISPHPDDESLGMGGLIATAAALGRQVDVVFVTSGEGSHRGSVTYPPAELARVRRAEATRAVDVLAPGRNAAHFLGLPDGGLSTLGEDRQAIDTLAAIMTPNAIVCVTSDTDPHPDHRQSFAWAREASRRAGAALWAYPVWTWMSDTPADESLSGVRLDISARLDTKRQAIAAHRSQHGLVVDDAEEAFTLPRAMIERLCQPHEVLIRVHD